MALKPAGGFGTDPVVGELIPDKKRSKEYKVTNRLQEGKRPLYAICFNLIDSRFHHVFASAGGNRVLNLSNRNYYFSTESALFQ